MEVDATIGQRGIVPKLRGAGMMQDAGVAERAGGGDVAAEFGPQNPFYAKSTLPYGAPPFDRIADSAYQPALEAGMAEQLREIERIASAAEAPSVQNTIAALEKSGALYSRAAAAFHAVLSANTNPVLEQVQTEMAPKTAAHQDAIYLNEKLFARIRTLHEQLETLKAEPEDKRAIEIYYTRFVHHGANLRDGEKETLRSLNEEESTLRNAFRTRLMAATKTAAYFTEDKATLAGFNDAQLAAAAAAARGQNGYLVPLQNTTQQPALASLSDRDTRRHIFERSWNRTEKGDANDTREIVLRLVSLRAEKAKLLGFPNYAAWKLADQMASSPEAAVRFVDALVPAATAHAVAEGREMQALIDAQPAARADDAFALEPWDWEFYAEQVRRAKYDVDEEEIKPYFELNRVLQDGVFYAATELYGIAFKERHDLPVYHPEVRVFEVFEADRKPLALFYCDFFKRDNKQGGAWMSSYVDQSKLLGQRPIICNVCNVLKPAPGEPALLSFDEVRTMFHEFGHALHGIFSDVQYPLLAGTDVPRDFVEFPSQFNEHWATYPTIFSNYARHCRTGAPMPAELVEKMRRAELFHQGYKLTELTAAAELDLEWHTLSAPVTVNDTGAFEAEALARKSLALRIVPPRYRSSYFQHIFTGGYSAGYYAYLWSEMLDNEAYEWFENHGGLTRENGDRLRRMVLSKGNSEDVREMYACWLGREPSGRSMLKQRGLEHPIVDSEAAATPATPN